MLASFDKKCCAMVQAIERDDVSAVSKLLLEGNVSPNEEDVRSRMPLSYARTLRMASLLVTLGAKIDMRSATRKTPLHLNSTPAVMEFLLQQGADATALDSNGATALHFVNHPKAVKMLVRHGVNVNERNCWGHTALHMACTNSDWQTVRALLKAGADFSIVDGQNRSSLNVLDALLELYTESSTDKQRWMLTKLYLSSWESATIKEPLTEDLKIICKRADYTSSLLPLRSISKNPLASLENATGIPLDVIEDILVKYAGPALPANAKHVPLLTESLTVYSTNKGIYTSTMGALTSAASLLVREVHNATTLVAPPA